MKIGILGGGQLARMLALAGHPLGIEVICIESAPGSSASNVTKVITADFSDMQTIEKHFAGVDCVTFETENLPIEAVSAVSQKFKMLPSLEALKIFQDRLLEKDFLNSLGIPTTEYIAVNSWDDIETAIKKIGFPFIVKTRLSGYDGKGQALIRNMDEAKSAWEKLKGNKLIIEKLVNFDCEVSLVSIRDANGEILFYPVILNKHQDGILQLSQAPYQDEKIEALARKYAADMLNKLNYVGVMAIEFFCCKGNLFANEVAPRVHNSGHLTIEGAETSQFENHLRAIAGLPLGSTKPTCFTAMINLIGKQPSIKKILSIPEAHYHWYNKEPRAGRKVGHVTLCSSDKDEVQKLIQHALELVE